MKQIVAAVVLVVLSAPFANAQRRQVETGFVDRTVTVRSETYRYQVFVPPPYSADRQWPIILSLHGGGERGFDGVKPTEVGIGRAIRKAPRRFPAIVVFPQVRPGHLWDNAMQAQALAALEHSIEEFHGDRDRVYLTGLSIGGRGAWALAFREPGRFAALVVITGPVMVLDRPSYTKQMRAVLLEETPFVHDLDPYRTVAAKLKHVPIWLFHGTADPIHPVSESRRMAAALRSFGAAVRYTEYEGVGHDSWDRAYADPEWVPWLLAQSRRPERQ
jgi:predicted peptidase